MRVAVDSAVSALRPTHSENTKHFKALVKSARKVIDAIGFSSEGEEKSGVDK